MLLHADLFCRKSNDAEEAFLPKEEFSYFDLEPFYLNLFAPKTRIQ